VDVITNRVDPKGVSGLADSLAGAAGDGRHTLGAEHERDEQRDQQ
jgi:hypothetical protein